MTTLNIHPLDEHNQTLLANVHPADWQNPTPSGRYNVVVVGGGTAGLITASAVAGLGGKVALVEKSLLGGDCLNVGCVPSKAIIRPASILGELRRAESFGLTGAESVQADFAAVMARMRRVRATIAPHDSAQRYTELGVDVFLGTGVFTGPDSLEVGGQTLNFSKAVIATGAKAKSLPIEGLDEVGFLTNETLFNLTEQPGSLAIIGAGPIGAEMAQTFQRFGTQVYMFDVAPQILIREDREAASIVEETLIKDGVKLLTGVKLTRFSRQDGQKLIRYQLDDESQQVAVDEILLAVGRAPNVTGLGLEAAGVEFDNHTGVQVDDHLQTSNPNIYAAGDVASPYQFTHAADAMARIVVRNALFKGRAKVSELLIPWCTYTEPEIAHVGLYAHQAEEEGVAIDTYRVPFSNLHRALTDGDEDGLLKIHTKKGSDKILGATIVARNAGDMISEISVAMVGGVGLGKIAEVIHPYPTQAEAIKQAADAYNRTRLKPFVKRLFGWWLARQR